MATFLYRVGRYAFRRRRLVTLVWVGLLVLIGFGAASAGSSSGSSLTVPGTESQHAFDLVKERFPGSTADGATGRVVFKATTGQVTSPQNKAAIEKAVRQIKAGSDQVASVADPFTAKAVNDAGTVAYIKVSYKTTPTELTSDTTDALKKAADDARSPALTVEVGGDALTTPPGVGVTELIGVLIAAVTLIVTFGGLVAAGLPLLTALIGVAIGVAGITALSSVLNLSSTTSILALMIGLAVGIDYALFIVSRYRFELSRGHEREEAAGRAVGTAGSAVLFAGLTVVIALAGLSVVNIPVLTQMGLAAAATVVIAVLVAMTFIPALLGFVGPKVFGRKARKDPAAALDTGSKERTGTRWSRFVLKHPVAVLLTSVVGLGVIAIPLGSLSMALPDDGHLPTSTTQRRAYDLLTEGFGAGFNGPLMVAVDGKDAKDPKAAVDSSAAMLAKVPGVASVGAPVFDTGGDTATINVIPKTGPNDGPTKHLVTAIRDASDSVEQQTGADVLVSGRTALNIDISQRLSDALVPYLAVVVGLAFVLLMLVFRSLLVPLKAALGFLASVLAALGSMVAVFQWGWLSSLTGVDQTGPVVSTMPIFLTGVVFGLAMDYEVFLVSRMREAHTQGAEAREAVVAGFTHGARIVTAGAIIMISVFLGFVGSTGSEIKMLGFGLGIAVLFDAFVVRMAIVPAVLALIGKAAWWLPSWLDRLLPNVDVEGENLRRSLAGAPHAEGGTGDLVDASA